jgi:hypothetical protein
MIVRWNLTGRKDRYRGQHTLVLSIGKSGRTWLRVLLNKFLSLRYNVPFELCDLSKLSAALPSIVYDHELWKHFSETTIGERMRGKYLIPPDSFQRKLILLFRDPGTLFLCIFKRRKGLLTRSIFYKRFSETPEIR